MKIVFYKNRITHIKIVFSLLLIIFNFNICSANNENKDFCLKSPDGSVQLKINRIKGNLKYTLFWEKDLIIDASEISILPDLPCEILKVKKLSNNSDWKPVWGQFSEIKNNYNELSIFIKIKNIDAVLITRIYDKGIGFRFELDGLTNQDSLNFYSEYNLAKNDEFYYPAGENEPIGPITFNELKTPNIKLRKLAIPFVVEKKSKKFISILESDLFSSKGFNTMKLNFNKNNGKLTSTSKPSKLKGKVITPWKVVLLGNTAGDLVSNTVAINLASPCEIENTDWIKPGKTLWDWRVHGYTTPDGFVYGVNTESYKRFIDFASEKEIEYFLIDANWYSKVTKGHFYVVDELNLEEVSQYAKTKNVKLILYYDRHKGDYGDKELFAHFNSLGMKGVKYGFMGNNVEFSRMAIRKSAENKMLIDFHDSPVPYTGVQRTYPNAITREYCHAQQDSRKAFTPEAFIKMALINAIQGPLDMNNGNFDLDAINRGERQKGPKKNNTYFSTVSSEVARTLIIFSGLVCIPDAPEAYQSKADLFEFIQKMPVGKWDDTKILNSSIGKHITTARRHGDQWFVGSVIDQKGGVLDIKLDFLKKGKKYEITYYEDTEETHCKTNRESYQIRKGKVIKGELIKAKLAPGGGHCMWIRPVN